METHHHRIRLPRKEEPKAVTYELRRLLNERGFHVFEPYPNDPEHITVDFFAPADADLDFLRPEFLPPK